MMGGASPVIHSKRAGVGLPATPVLMVCECVQKRREAAQNLRSAQFPLVRACGPPVEVIIWPYNLGSLARRGIAPDLIDLQTSIHPSSKINPNRTRNPIHFTHPEKTHAVQIRVLLVKQDTDRWYHRVQLSKAGEHRVRGAVAADGTSPGGELVPKLETKRPSFPGFVACVGVLENLTGVTGKGEAWRAKGISRQTSSNGSKQASGRASKSVCGESARW